ARDALAQRDAVARRQEENRIRLASVQGQIATQGLLGSPREAQPHLDELYRQAVPLQRESDRLKTERRQAGQQSIAAGQAAQRAHQRAIDALSAHLGENSRTVAQALLEADSGADYNPRQQYIGTPRPITAGHYLRLIQAGDAIREDSRLT